MANWMFIRRLRKELPVWVEKGWVRAGDDQAILAHAAGEGGARLFTYAISVLGVLLLGSGIITFFAANWDSIAKITKLLLLFGSMWLAYGAAAYLLTARQLPHLGSAVLLLGVILFGANIMLIAQIYHIDEHFPNGVLLWALGGLLTAYLLQSQAAMVAALALGTLWSMLEGFNYYREVHWWYLVFLAACLPPVVRREWLFATHVALIGVLLWSTHVYSDLHATRSALYLTQFYFLAYLALFLLGLVLAARRTVVSLAGPMQRYALFGSLLAFYALTFPKLQTGGLWWFRDHALGADTTLWRVLVLAALAVVISLALWHRRLSGGAQRPAYLQWGLLLVVLGAALVLVNLFLYDSVSGDLVAIGFNLLFFTAMVWLVFAGMHTQDRFLVNIAFAFFVLALMTRYFDTFWTLLNRSFFFMTGGVILLVGGYFLERQRRRLMQQIIKESGEAER